MPRRGACGALGHGCALRAVWFVVAHRCALGAWWCVLRDWLRGLGFCSAFLGAWRTVVRWIVVDVRLEVRFAHGCALGVD